MTVIQVRRAGAADVEALVVLRAAMFAAMGTDPGGAHASWRAPAPRWFTAALAEPVESLRSHRAPVRREHAARPRASRLRPRLRHRRPRRGPRGDDRRDRPAGRHPAGSGIYRAPAFGEFDHPTMRVRPTR